MLHNLQTFCIHCIAAIVNVISIVIKNECAAATLWHYEMQRDTKEADKSIFSKLYFHYFCGKQFTQKPQKASIFFF